MIIKNDYLKRHKQRKMKTPYFTYTEQLIPDFYFDILHDEIKDKVGEGTKNKRKSCLFNLHTIDLFQKGYDSIPYYQYSEIPTPLSEIRTIVEKETKQIFDYVLVHIYENGRSSINWHADFEAKNSFIASVSLGATRKFRFKEIGKKQGYDYEFQLQSGDMVVMNKPSSDYIGCQDKYFHCVPSQSKIKEPRINLTFRQFEI